jgi:hypothetical protein
VPGDYRIIAKEWHCLAKGVDVTLPPVGTVDFPVQENGDSDDNNVIAGADFGTLAFFFGQSYDRDCTFRATPADRLSVWHADFDGSGAVAGADFGNLNFNFGYSGDECSTPASPILVKTGVNLNAAFSLQPNLELLGTDGNVGMPIGDDFDVAIVAETVTDLYTYSFEVTYDANSLELLQSGKMAAMEGQFLKNTGNKPSLFFARKKVGQPQRVVVAGSVTGQQAGVSGNGVVALLKFRVISENPGTILLTNINLFDHDLNTNLLPDQQLTIQPVPKHTVFLQNYPNPFNPETWIPYRLAGDADVSIRIHNVSGQLIRSIELGNQPAGYHETRDRAAYWDGRNESGEFASSGVYFYTIQAGDFVATRKMILLK